MAIFSVIVPCYNQGEFLDECLQSVLQQSFEDWECIIVNDGSTDGSEVIAKKWVEKEARFKLLSIKNGGVSNARNQGISQASGTYILPLDADDYLASTYLERAMRAFKDYPSSKVVYGRVMLVGDKQATWDLPEFSIYELAMSNIIPVSGIYLKSDWESINGYDSNMTKGLEDWEYWLHLLKDNPIVYYLEETTFYYRIKKQSRNTQVDPLKQKEIQKYVYQKHIDFYNNTFGTYQNLLKKLKYNSLELEAFKNSFSYRIFTLSIRVKKWLKTLLR